MYLLKDFANFATVSTKTMQRRIKELKQKGAFKKESPGKFYTDKEADQLQELVGFTINKR